MSKLDHNDTNDILRSKLEGIQYDAPASLKRKVHGDFNRVHRRRLIFWWFFGGLSGAAGLALMLWLWSANDEVLPVTSAVTSSDVSSNAPVPATMSPAVQDVFANKQGETDKGVLAETKADANSSGSAASLNSSQAITSKAEAQAKETATAVLSTPLSTDGGVSLPPSNGIAVATVSTAAAAAEEPKDVADYSSAPITSNPPPKQDNFIATASKVDESRMLALSGMPSMVPVLPFNWQTIPRGLCLNRSYPGRSDLPYFEEKGACPSFIIGASAGVGLSYRTLQSNVHHELVAHKNQSEHAALSASAGLYGVATLFRQSGLKAGFTYLRVGERYHFENDHASHATVNTYEYLNMDLKFNQTLFCNKRLRLDAAAGSKFNLLRDAQSSWLDPSSFEAVAHNNEGEHSPFRTYNVVWSADLTAYYFVGKRGFVGLTVEADRFQNSIYKDAVALEQRPYAFQTYFNIGVRF